MLKHSVFVHHSNWVLKHKRRYSDMFQTAESLLVYVIDIGYRILRWVLHYLLALVYWSRSRTVPPVQNPILKMPATELAKQIREGKLSSEMVVRTFIDRIREVEPYINATVECRFGDALREARDVDVLVTHLDNDGRQRMEQEKPFLGVPFTVKILLTVKGMRSTAGCLLFQDVRAQEDSSAVALMKRAGGIVLCTTNSAEMGMNFETNNFVHGTTNNPYDTSRTSGGSSGGESAIISAAGSVIGLGNDMAGSIRVPSAFCGIFGHKPSKGVVSNGGTFPIPFGNAKHFLYTGPMCRYAQDLQAMMTVLSPGNDKQFAREVNFRNIKVYYIYSFGHIPVVENVHPEIQDAVRKVISYFETKYGCRSKEVSIPVLRHSNGIIMHSFGSSFPSNLIEGLTGGKSKADPSQEMIKMLFRQSIFTIGPLIATNVFNLSLFYKPSLVRFYAKMEEELRRTFANLLDDDSILVMPTLPFPATYHHEISLMPASSCYSHIFNVLGNPSTQCPVGLNKSGLPTGVQVVGKVGNDSLTLACAIELEKAFGGWIPPK